MINSINSAQGSYAEQPTQPVRSPQQPPAQTQKSGELSEDTVTLKSAGTVNNENNK